MFLNIFTSSTPPPPGFIPVILVPGHQLDLTRAFTIVLQTQTRKKRGMESEWEREMMMMMAAWAYSPLGVQLSHHHEDRSLPRPLPRLFSLSCWRAVASCGPVTCTGTFCLFTPSFPCLNSINIYIGAEGVGSPSLSAGGNVSLQTKRQLFLRSEVPVL